MQHIINFVSLGSIYAVATVGLTLLFGVMEIPNFAQGEILIFSCYIILTILSYLPNLYMSSIIGLILIGLLGAGLMKTVFSKIEKISTTDVMILTFSLSMMIQGLELIIWTSDYRILPPLMEGVIDVYGARCSIHRILATIIAISSMIFMWLFLNKTNIGKAIQATQQDKDAAKILGINTEFVYMITMAVSFILVGIAGIVLCPIILVYPAQGATIVLKSFAIIIFGGMGSIKGAIICSYILGFLESIVAGFISFEYKDAIDFLILLIVTAIRPKGLFGRE